MAVWRAGGRLGFRGSGAGGLLIRSVIWAVWESLIMSRGAMPWTTSGVFVKVVI